YRDAACGHVQWRLHDLDAGELGHRSPAHRSRWAIRVQGEPNFSLRVRSADQWTSGGAEGASDCPDICGTAALSLEHLHRRAIASELWHDSPSVITGEPRNASEPNDGGGRVAGKCTRALGTRHTSVGRCNI